MERRHYDDPDSRPALRDDRNPALDARPQWYRDSEYEREDVYIARDAAPATRTRPHFDLPGRANTVLFAVLTALEALLALRFTLVAFGANRANGFIDFVMDISWPFVGPFDGAFNNRTWDEGIIEVSTLLAMSMWLLLFAVIMLFVSAIVPKIDEPTGTRYHRRRVTHTG